MKQVDFITRFYPDAEVAGQTFGINPVVILAQAILESGWGESVLSKVHNNFFGITAYGTPNEYWHGCRVSLQDDKMKFRKYSDARNSFLDYARLIRQVYPRAAEMSYSPESFAKEIAYSRYISEINGDNREEYRRALCKLCRQINTKITTL